MGIVIFPKTLHFEVIDGMHKSVRGGGKFTFKLSTSPKYNFWCDLGAKFVDNWECFYCQSSTALNSDYQD